MFALVEIGGSIFQVFRNLDIRSLHAPVLRATLECTAGILGASAAERPPITWRGAPQYYQAENGDSRDERPIVNGRAVAKPIETGRRSLERVEVLSGLAEGDLVIGGLADPKAKQPNWQKQPRVEIVD